MSSNSDEGQSVINIVDGYLERLTSEPLQERPFDNENGSAEKKQSSNIHFLLNEIAGTINELDQSVQESHSAERMIFQNELQLMIDKHRLDFELEREKCKNERLKRMNFEHNIYSNSNQKTRCEVKYWRDKYHALIMVIRKRTNQICKALVQIKDLKNENTLLKKRLKEKDLKIKELSIVYEDSLKQMNDKIKKIEEETIIERQKYTEHNLQIALQEQIKQNRQLMFNNCQLKNQLAHTKTIEKFNVATQINDYYLKEGTSEDMSG